jgi:hypothetical protein
MLLSGIPGAGFYVKLNLPEIFGVYLLKILIIFCLMLLMLKLSRYWLTPAPAIKLKADI